MAREDGVALVIALMALTLMTALGVAVILTSSSETIIAAHFRSSLEARYAADAMIERALDGLTGAADWNALIDGVTTSPWVDGAPAGPRTLRDGSTIDLGQVVNLATCQKTTACSQADREAVTADRPWGANNPRWTLYAYGPLGTMLPAANAVDSPYYVLLLVGNGPSVTSGVIAMRSEAYGPRGAHKVIEATVARTAVIAGNENGYNDGSGQGAVRILSWREVR